MKQKRTFSTILIIVAGVAMVHLAAGDRFLRLLTAQQPATVTPEESDREVIMKSAREFADCFNKGDAKAIAAMWTQNGESRDANGRTLVGRAEIEKAYAELFKGKTGTKIEVMVKSVRFPAKDLAVEERLLREARYAKDLPTTTAYVAIHIREGGKWRIALASEGHAGQDRLEDIEWLLGDWTTKVKGDTVVFSFARNAKKPIVMGGRGVPLSLLSRLPPAQNSNEMNGLPSCSPTS